MSSECTPEYKFNFASLSDGNVVLQTRTVNEVQNFGFDFEVLSTQKELEYLCSKRNFLKANDINYLFAFEVSKVTDLNGMEIIRRISNSINIKFLMTKKLRQ